MTDWMYGRHPVLEALRAGVEVRRLFVARGTKPQGALKEILDQAAARGVAVQWVEREVLDRHGPNHQGVAAEVAAFAYADVDDIFARAAERDEPPLIVVLDSIQDVQNLGQLIRTAEAVGVHGIILPEHRSAGVTPAVRKSSAGAVEHIPIAQVTNLARTLDHLKRRDVWVVGLDMAGQDVYNQVDLTMPLALVVGSEGRGLARLTREKCDFLVRLPMRGKVESLNAAVAGSVVLYEVLRQRGSRPSFEGRRREG